MADILRLIQQRRSTRVRYDPNRPVAKEDLRQIVEAARWASTAHNMQNFDIIVVDDKRVLEKIGNIKSQVSEAFIRENYRQLSFSEEELLQKKVGILGTVFPADWRDPARLDKAVRESRPTALNRGLMAVLCCSSWFMMLGRGLLPRRGMFWVLSAWAASWRTCG